MWNTVQNESLQNVPVKQRIKWMLLEDTVTINGMSYKVTKEIGTTVMVD